MRLNEILIAACVSVCALPCFGKQLDESIFRARPSASDQGTATFKRTAQQSEAPSANPEQLRELELLNAKIVKQPHNDMFYADRAYLYIKLKQFHKAMDDINHAISINPTFAHHFEIRAAVKGNLNDNFGELSDLTESIKLDPNRAYPYSMKAATFMALGMYFEAPPFIDKAIQLDPNQSSFYFIKAEILAHHSDKVDAAIASCDKGLALSPHDPTGLALKSKLANQAANRSVQPIEKSADNSEVLHKLEIANAKILEQPNNDVFYAGRAELYFDLHQFQKALDDVNHAISIRGPFAGYLELRAGVKGNLSDRSGELLDLDNAIKLDPQRAHPYAMKASTLALLGRWAEALPAADKALELNPSKGDYYIDRAEILGHLDKVDAAIANCDKGLTLLPNDPSGLELRGKLLKLSAAERQQNARQNSRPNESK